VVTFDSDLRSGARRRGCRCLLIRTPEVTAVERLRLYFSEMVGLFEDRHPLVTLPIEGAPA